MLLKVVILFRDWRTECFKCLIVIEFSALFYFLIDGATELSFMRFLQLVILLISFNDLH